MINEKIAPKKRKIAHIFILGDNITPSTAEFFGIFGAGSVCKKGFCGVRFIFGGVTRSPPPPPKIQASRLFYDFSDAP
ncbi:MAG: hypothetical protein IKY76_06510 [Alistipes sp.]|nr:hypothetical protein [Alistipes sp.]